MAGSFREKREKILRVADGWNENYLHVGTDRPQSASVICAEKVRSKVKVKPRRERTR